MIFHAMGFRNATEKKEDRMSANHSRHQTLNTWMLSKDDR